jgi:hypothetical protein
MPEQFSNQKSEGVGFWLGITMLCILIAVLTIGLMGKFYQWINNAGPYRTVIIGKILTKQTQFHESESGSLIDWQIIIVEKDGNQETILVDDKTYAQAQVGWWLKKDGRKFQIDKKEIEIKSAASEAN